MKKRQHEHLDEILRHRLEKVESPVPDDMWSRIQNARKNKRIHPLGWYYFSASALLVASLSLWLCMGSPTAEQVNSLEETRYVQDNKTTHRSTNASSSADVADPNQATSEDSNHHQLEDQSSKSSLSHEKSMPSGKAVKGTSNRTQQTLIKPDQANSLKAPSGKEATSNVSFNHGAAAKERADQNRGADQGARIAGSNLNNDQTNKNIVEGTVNQNDKRRIDQPVMELDYRFAAADQLTRNGYSEVHSNATRKLPGMPKLTKRKSSPSCYSFNSFLRGISVDLYLAPEYASRQLVYKDPTMVGYAEQRKNDESYVFAYSAGFRVNAHFKGGLALRTGLIYTDIVEKLKYRDENAQITKVINVTLDTFYENGNIVYIWDTLSVTEYGSYNKVGYNRYRFYDIPLIMGYEIDRGNWVIQLNTGVMFNVAAAQRGDFLDPDHQLVNFDSNNGQGYKAFRTRVGSSLLMSMGFNYALRPKLHLLVEPQLRVWLQPLNIQSYPVDQKYINLGLAMGIRQYF